MRIAIAEFSHETCTFCPDRTTISTLEPHVKRGQEVMDSQRGIPTYVNGFMKGLSVAPDVELVPIISVGMAPGPYTSWFDTECFDKYTAEIQSGLKEASQKGELNGVLLALHGAMAVTGVPKPEAEIVRRVREVVGAIPIMVTLDLHANEDHELTDASDAVFVLKTYPHVDSEQTGMIAARCMLDTIRGNVSPTQALHKPGFMSASIYQASDYHPMKDIYEKCREWEKHEGVICVSAAPGFAYADVPDVGMSVIAVTDDDLLLAEKIAKDVSDFAWTLRESFSRPLPRPKEGVAEVIKMVASGQSPVVVCDGADRTGDSTHILRELLEQGATDFAIPGIADPEAADELERSHKVGDRVTIAIGGWAGEYSGDPVEVTGVVEYVGRPEYVLVGPMGKGRKVKDGLTVRLNLGENRHVVVSERMRGANDSAGLTSVGIDVGTLDIIVLKDRVHHRAFWDTVTEFDYPIDAPGIGPADLRTLTYHNIPKDIYPVGRKWNK